jgi:hypothetical protein
MKLKFSKTRTDRKHKKIRNIDTETITEELIKQKE